jgi:hypothetical protein
MVIRRYRTLNERNLRTFFEEGLFSRNVPTFCDDNEGLIERPAENPTLRAGAVATANNMRRRRGIDKLDLTPEEFREGLVGFHHQARNKYFANCWRLGTNELDRIWKEYTGDDDMIEGFAFETTVGQFIRALPTDTELEDEEPDGCEFDEMPVDKMYAGQPSTDMHVGAVRYQMRELPGEFQPAGYQSSINFFKGSGFDHELEFRFLFNPFDSAKLVRFDMNARPVGTQPDIDQEYRYFPMDTREMIDRIILAPNADSSQRERIEEVLDQIGVSYDPREQDDLEIVESNSNGRSLHTTHPYSTEFDGTNNYEGTPEYLNESRNNFVDDSDPDTWPVLDLVELRRERCGTVIEGYRHPTDEPIIDMEEYGHDEYQSVVVNRVSANDETQQYMNEKEVRRVVSDALDAVIEKDSELLEFDVNERSITHRLAMYLQEAVGDAWDVDTEYNRIGKEDDVTKRIPSGMLPDGSQGRVYPDVIIHQRGVEDENVLIIEAKKSDSSEKDDKQKINAYIEHLNYEQGLFVNFDTGQDIDEFSYHCDWYPFEEKSD